MRKSITTRYFYSTAVLLICSIAVMGFIQMYLAIGYFREENGTALIQTIDNAILAMQEAADDGIVEKRAEAAEAAGLDVEDIKRGITLTARAAGKSILVTDAYGSVVLSIPSEYQGMEVSVKTCNATYSRGIYDEMGTLGGIFSSRYYIAGKPILDEKGMLQGFVFAGANADSLTEYLANLFSTLPLRRADADGIQRAFHRADQPHDHAAAPHFGRREKVRRRRFFRPRARGGRR